MIPSLFHTFFLECLGPVCPLEVAASGVDASAMIVGFAVPLVVLLRLVIFCCLFVPFCNQC